jgi:hypothetical protein
MLKDAEKMKNFKRHNFPRFCKQQKIVLGVERRAFFDRRERSHLIPGKIASKKRKKTSSPTIHEVPIGN